MERVMMGLNLQTSFLTPPIPDDAVDPLDASRGEEQ
jgi:hypothetical protein